VRALVSQLFPRLMTGGSLSEVGLWTVAWRKKKKKKKMPAGLLDRLRRISVFANEVADGTVYEETEILEKTIRRMFGVMHMVAEYSCDYVRRGRFGR